MTDYIVYNSFTGEILRTGMCQESDIGLQAHAGETVVDGHADDATQYINTVTKSVVNKTVLPASINKTSISADGVDSITISNLPMPSNIEIDGEGSWQVTDGIFEFTTDCPGIYRVVCRSALYLKVEYTINAS